MKCKYDKGGGCLNCERVICILDEEPEEDIGPAEKRDRKDYHHSYYLKCKEKSRKSKICNWCGSEAQGETIRIDGKNYCGIDCVLCHLYEKNEKRMEIVSV